MTGEETTMEQCIQLSLVKRVKCGMAHFFSNYGLTNYCRAPKIDADSYHGPWCYVDGYPYWEHCFIPICNKDCIRNRNDKNYNGTLNVTISGYHCRPWKYDPPIDGTPPRFHGETLNYCRTPHGYTQTIPWCYTISAKKRLEICNVSLCGDIRSTICPDLIGSNMLIEPSILTGHQYNSVVHFRCKNGYMIHGPSAIKCIVNSQSTIIGHWNATQPECVGIKCPSITIRHSNISNMSSTRFPGRIEVACNSGYQLNGNSSIKCNASGNWSNKPTCDAILCPDLVSSDRLITPTQLSGYLNGSVVVFKCKIGYKIQGPTVISCMRDSEETITGHWNATQPKCVAVSCPVLILRPHIVQPIKVSGYRYHDKITFVCDTGYNVVGNITITCTASGQWSGYVPTCDPLSCPVLNIPNIKKPSHPIKYYFKDTVHIQCESGFMLNGPADLKCLATGHWNAQFPVCQYVSCKTNNIPPNVIVLPLKMKYFYNESVTFFCDAEFFGTSVRSTCNVYGQWKPAPSKCSRRGLKSESSSRVVNMVFGVLFGCSLICIAALTGVVIHVRRKLKEATTPYEDIKMSKGSTSNRKPEDVYTELN